MSYQPIIKSKLPTFKDKYLSKKQLKIIILPALLAALLITGTLFYNVFLKQSSQDTFTYAQAAKMIASACADKKQLEESYGNQNWYDKYIAFVVANGYMEEKKPTAGVTYQDVEQWVTGLGVHSDYYNQLNTEKKSRKISKKDFVNVYIELIRVMDTAGRVHSLEAGIVGTPLNVPEAEAWQAYTTEGVYSFEGLSLDYAIDCNAVMIVKEDEILCVQGILDNIVYQNTWVMNGTGSHLQVYAYGVVRNFTCKELEQSLEGVMADISLEKGEVKAVNTKTDTINGKILSATDSYIEIEGYGKVPLDTHYKIYNIKNTIREKSYQDLIVGYDLQNLIVANGKICGAAIQGTLNADKVRVLIKTSGFANILHQNVVLTADAPFQITYGRDTLTEGGTEKEVSFQPGDIITVGAESEYLTGGRMKVTSTGKIQLLSVDRAQGKPSYVGTMEIASEPEGLVIVNEVSIEEYLKKVIPSEMPTSFGVEALKVQAVCARSYVYRELNHNNYVQYGAHVDDSTLYQVYNNSTGDAASAQAVEDTEGEVLSYQGEIVQAYYYSTSCGVTTDVSLWGSASEDYPYFQSKAVCSGSPEVGDLTQEECFAAFIKEVHAEDYDRSFDLYRWKINATVKEFSDSINSKIGERSTAFPQKILVQEGNTYVNGPVSDIGTIQKIQVEKRVQGGAITSLLVEGSKKTIRILGENNIRYLMGMSGVPMTTANGNLRTMASLPSTFCIFEPTYENGVLRGFVITGGGYGHGIGMSQNAVSTMVKQNMNYQQILQFFYPGTTVQVQTL